jgi:Outer membrane protein beta-barrel domain
MPRFTAISSALLLVCLALAPDAAAQGFVNPFVGTTLAAASLKGDTSRAGFGVAFGKIGKIVGFDTEVAWYPELLNNAANALAKNKVVTFSANTLIGPTLGPIKVYGAIGAGALYLNVTSVSSVVLPNPESFSSTYFAFNVGGGVMGFFNSHLGVRGDLRYHRAFGLDLTDLAESAEFEFALDRFDFWRASIGLVVKF